MQGLFAHVGSGDPVRVLRLFHNNYTGYCCIHLLCRATYNFSLPRLSANYYGLPTTVQLRAAHESRSSLVGVSRSTALQVLYCTCLERYHYGTVQSRSIPHARNDTISNSFQRKQQDVRFLQRCSFSSFRSSNAHNSNGKATYPAEFDQILQFFHLTGFPEIFKRSGHSEFYKCFCSELP